MSICFAILFSLWACGARTGLHGEVSDEPSSNADASLDSAEDRDVVGCAPGRFDLNRAVPSVMLVLDRSRSMADRLSDGRTRWNVLSSALARTLPPVDQTIQLGALVYPSSSGGNGGVSCNVSGSADLTPALGNVDELLSIVRARGPNGSTPTATAIDTAASVLSSQRTASRARAMVLATDGAPACNSALDSRTCTCVTGGRCGSRPERCLDDVRTVERIAAHNEAGIPTYVIGIQDSTSSSLSDVLDRMAIAGGRSKATGSRRFYAASSEPELDLALSTIRDQVSACTFLTSSVPSADGTILVSRGDGTLIPFDSSGKTGWFWGNQSNGEIILASDACSDAVDAGRSLTVDVTCDPIRDAGRDSSAARDASARDGSAIVDAAASD